MPYNTPLVSVIIPCFNSEKWILQTLNSVFAQSYNNIEIILVDDGSTDRTKEMILNYSRRVTYVYQENKGPAAARNKGISYSTGKYICFLDSDDLWEIDKVEAQVEILEENENIALCITNVKVVDFKNNYLYTQSNPMPKSKKDKILYFFLGKIGMSTPTIMVRKKVLTDGVLFDENLPRREDHDFIMNVLQNYEIFHFEKPMVRRRINESSLTQTEKVENYYFLNKPFIEKSLRNFPFLKKFGSKAYSNINYTIGMKYWKQSKYFMSLIYILRSLLQDPFVLKKYPVFLLMFLRVNYAAFARVKMRLKK